MAGLPSAEVLTREQLRNILRATYGGSLECSCDDDACHGKGAEDACMKADNSLGKCTWQACNGCGYNYFNCI